MGVSPLKSVLTMLDSLMATPYRSPAASRRGICVNLDPALVATVRQEAVSRGVQQWWVVDAAVRRGLPLLPPPGQETLFANSETGDDRLDVTGMSRKTRARGRPAVAVFAEVHEDLIHMLAQEVTARDAHQWWVVENALRLGLPLLPEPGQGVMLRSA